MRNKNRAEALSDASDALKIDNRKEIEKLGSRIKQLRIRQGYSSYENFALAKDINRSQFWRYEKGADMRYCSLLKVIKALGITRQEFFSQGFGEDEKG